MFSKYRFYLLLVFLFISPFLYSTSSHANQPNTTFYTSNYLNPCYRQSNPRVSAHLSGLLCEFQQEKQTFSSKRTPWLIQQAENTTYVTIDAIAKGNPDALLQELETLGLQHGATAGNLVSGLLPIEAVDRLSQVKNLRFAQPAVAETDVGLVTSQAVEALVVETSGNRLVNGLEGSGLTIGVMSDSFDNYASGTPLTTYADDVTNGDLPAGIILLDDTQAGTDEGRAMAQLIYDIAPSSQFIFHTAFGGIANFATGISDLVTAGADIIVDDVTYYTQPMFQDGLVAKAANDAFAAGVPYFSAAGNRARQSYEADFTDSGFNIGVPTTTCSDGVERLHDFDPGAGVDVQQQIVIPAGIYVLFSVQWNEPFASVSPSGGAQTELDFFINIGGTIYTWNADNNVGNDAVTLLPYDNSSSSTDATISLLIGRCASESTTSTLPRIKYIYTRSLSSVEYATNSSTIMGHKNATGAMAIGAAFYENTPAFGTNPPLLESFSSAGQTLVYYDSNGNAFPTPQNRQKPDVVAPDGTNTSFFGTDIANDTDSYPNFFGTSASAPNAAAVAALVKEYDPLLTPAKLYALLRTHTIDMNTPGYDDDTGYGYIELDDILTGLQPDFGDLPDMYGTRFIDDGARHFVPPGGARTVYLGTNAPDTELDGQPSANATGDAADEDGVTPTGNWNSGTGSVQVTVSGGKGCLMGWLDYSDGTNSTPDGDFNDAGETIINNQPVNVGTQNFSFSLPPNAAGGKTFFARFRIIPDADGDGDCTDQSALASTGPANDGEVEDYAWSFNPTLITLETFAGTADSHKSPWAESAFVGLLLVVASGILLFRRQRH